MLTAQPGRPPPAFGWNPGCSIIMLLRLVPVTIRDWGPIHSGTVREMMDSGSWESKSIKMPSYPNIDQSLWSKLISRPLTWSIRKPGKPPFCFKGKFFRHQLGSTYIRMDGHIHFAFHFHLVKPTGPIFSGSYGSLRNLGSSSYWNHLDRLVFFDRLRIFSLLDP